MGLVTIAIRLQRPEDDSAVCRVLTASFEDDGRVAALAAALRGRVDRGTALVAVDGHSRVLGHTQLSVSWVDARERLVEVLVLSPLAVAPTHQS
jgi:putative acetyltransferase